MFFTKLLSERLQAQLIEHEVSNEVWKVKSYKNAKLLNIAPCEYAVQSNRRVHCIFGVVYHLVLLSSLVKLNCKKTSVLTYV